MNELINAYEEYIKLLTDELDDLVGLAVSHGWKSHRYEEGKRLRELIEDKKKSLDENK